MGERFTAWCQAELFTTEVIRATAILNRYCDLLLAGVYRALNLGPLLCEAKTGPEIAAALGFVESAAITMTAMLSRSAERGGFVVAVDHDGVLRFEHRRDPEDPSAELARLRAEMGTLGEDYSAALEFLDFGAEHFSEALKDDPDFMDRMLSGRDAKFQELWNRATNVDPLQDLHGRMGARAILELFERGRILEIGGGTGNGIRHLFATFDSAGALDRIDDYLFTDISQRFILGTRKEIKKKHPTISCDWRHLDINHPFEAQKIGPSSVDLIYGVNAAHVAKDIVGFLEQCRATLRPGGRVVFAERIRINPLEMAPRELTLNLSVYHRSAAERTDDRPMHCYLAPQNWMTVLDKAGFEAVILPDLEAMKAHFPDQYAAVVVGAKR